MKKPIREDRAEIATCQLTTTDLPHVVKIDTAASEWPLLEDEIIGHQRQRNGMGICLTRGGKTVGFLLYSFYRSSLHLDHVSVDPKYQRRGYGKVLVDRLRSKMGARTRIFAFVREGSVGSQMFMKACGFKAERILKCHFENTYEDAYVFAYRLPDDDNMESDENEEERYGESDVCGI